MKTIWVRRNSVICKHITKIKFLRIIYFKRQIWRRPEGKWTQTVVLMSSKHGQGVPNSCSPELDRYLTLLQNNYGIYSLHSVSLFFSKLDHSVFYSTVLQLQIQFVPYLHPDILQIHWNTEVGLLLNFFHDFTLTT